MIAAMLWLFSRKATRAPMKLTIPPVPKSAELERAEKQLQALLARQVELSTQVVIWNSKLGSAAGDAFEMNSATNELTKLEKQQRQCRETLIGVRTEIESLWPYYAASVRKAVASQRRAAASQILDALNLYNEAIARLKITEEILTAARANPKKLTGLPFVPAAVNATKGIIAECNRDERAQIRVLPNAK
jgi:hypothetical protein